MGFHYINEFLRKDGKERWNECSRFDFIRDVDVFSGHHCCEVMKRFHIMQFGGELGAETEKIYSPETIPQFAYMRGRFRHLIKGLVITTTVFSQRVGCTISRPLRFFRNLELASEKETSSMGDSNDEVLFSNFVFPSMLPPVNHVIAPFEPTQTRHLLLGS